jgi:hypothetical protein
MAKILIISNTYILLNIKTVRSVIYPVKGLEPLFVLIDIVGCSIEVVDHSRCRKMFTVQSCKSRSGRRQRRLAATSRVRRAPKI